MPISTSRLFAAALLLATAVPAAADEVTDTIQSALDAYEEGDVAYAAEELTFALQLLKEMRAGDLMGFLPEPQDGWTRELDPDAAAALSMMGGTGAAAEYSSGSDDFTVTLMMDSPMIAGMAAMFTNPALITSGGGKMVRVGREKFVAMEGTISGLVGNRVLVQAEGDNTDAIVAHLETMDLRGLSQFGL
ncbi:MAG: hypothetical protein QNJ13_02510 [Paracoccaceae bacterium]|nr:hypothetical protein [Paracoccaceae bacterium]